MNHPSRAAAIAVGAVFVVIGACVPVTGQDTGSKLKNLFRNERVSIDATTIRSDERTALGALTDGDPKTVGGATASEPAPLEIVFGFGGATVAIEQLVLYLPEKAPEGSSTGKVEILVSTLSASTGFRAVPIAPLKRIAGRQEFPFRPTAARWIMLRLTPASGGTKVVVAEIEGLGHPGPPATHYEFKQSPAKALDVMARLKAIPGEVSVSPEEAALFEDAKDGRLDTWSFGEAALLASGVTDAERRKRQLDKLDQIESAARKAMAKATNPFARGEILLKLLHSGAMSKGYSAHQTDVSVILDTGAFNCVSSATLYNILGRRLGLDLRAVEVPDHAFSILYDGTRHADVETTTAQGFNPSRDPAAAGDFEQKTGFRYIPDSHRDQRREIDEIGLIAIIYYNHGVALSNEKRFHAALMSYFRALSLDREFASAVKNALAVLGNWSGHLAGERKFKEALTVLRAGLDLAPTDQMLVHNHKAVWQQWAEALIDAGKSDQALAIIRRAAKEIPDERDQFLSMEAWVFLKNGEALVRDGKWEQALATVESGSVKLKGRPLEELVSWRNGLYLRWSNAELKARRFDLAAQVLENGLKVTPGESRLAGNLAYVAQEWLKDAYAREGEEKARAVAVTLMKQFGTLPAIPDVIEDHVRRVIADLSGKEKFEDALSTVGRHKALLIAIGRGKNGTEMTASVYEGWAQAHLKRKRWAEAADVYEVAWKAAGDRAPLPPNVPFIAQEWIKDAHARDGEEKAKAIAIALFRRFKQAPAIKDVALNHLRRLIDSLVQAGKFGEAIASVDRHADLLEALDDKNERKAHLERVYDMWAKTFFHKKQWAKAIEIYKKGLLQVPGSGLLTTNLKYCEQEAKR